MKNQIVNSVISLLILCSAVAQDNAATTGTKIQDKAKATKEGKSDPTVDAVLERYLKAIGGREAVEKLRSQKAKATIDSENGPQKAELIRKVPDKWLFSVIDDSGKPSFQQGSNGRQRWTRNADGVSKEDVNETETRLFRLDRAANFRSLFAIIKLEGQEKAASWKVFVLEATPTKGLAHHLTFDAKTGLLLREAYSSGGNPSDHEMQYDDYKEVDGVKMPFMMRSSGGDNWTLRFKEVINNAPLEDTQFDPPAK